MYKFSEGWEPNQLHRRLRNTWVFHRGQLRPYENSERTRDNGIVVFLGGSRFPLAEIDLRTPRFGFTNVSIPDKAMMTAAFITRIPVRNDWRQGVTQNQLRVSKGVGFNDILRGANKSSLEDSLSGKFFPVKQALDLLEEEYDSVAVSRNFAINEDRKVLYQNNNEHVGWIEGEGSLRLERKYAFLKEISQKEMRVAES